MSYFIIIRGPLGCGKTTISKQLSKILNAKHIAIDEVLEKNGLDKVPPDAPCIPVENFVKANEIAIPLAKEYLKNNIVIFDGCFYHKEAIDHLVEKLSCPNYIFTLKAPLEICIKRDAERDRVYGEGAAKAVYGLVSRFDYGTVIDASEDVEMVVGEIFSYLPN
ncbi:MAG: AAA family ATPase [bacterium]